MKIDFWLSESQFFYSMCRPIIILSVALSVLLFTSCGKGRGKDDVKPRCVRATRVSAVDYIDRDFAGMATADDAVNLAFKLSGQVLSVDVAKGDYVKKGDIIVKLGGKDTGSLAEFRYELYKHKVGDKLEVTYYRDGKKNTTDITLGKSE